MRGASQVGKLSFSVVNAAVAAVEVASMGRRVQLLPISDTIVCERTASVENWEEFVSDFQIIDTAVEKTIPKTTNGNPAFFSRNGTDMASLEGILDRLIERNASRHGELVTT